MYHDPYLVTAYLHGRVEHLHVENIRWENVNLANLRPSASTRKKVLSNPWKILNKDHLHPLAVGKSPRTNT
jgi:hypothetical protein